jgi:hypothetical protein
LPLSRQGNGHIRGQAPFRRLDSVEARDLEPSQRERLRKIGHVDAGAQLRRLSSGKEELALRRRDGGEAGIEVAFDDGLRVGAQLRSNRSRREVLVHHQRVELDLRARREAGVFDTPLDGEALPPRARRRQLEVYAVGGGPHIGVQLAQPPRVDRRLLDAQLRIRREPLQGLHQRLDHLAVGGDRVELLLLRFS